MRTTSTYVKSYDGQTKWMQFLVEDDDFNTIFYTIFILFHTIFLFNTTFFIIKTFNTIWDKVSADTKKM